MVKLGKEYLLAIERGQAYLKALEDYRAGRYAMWEMVAGGFGGMSHITENALRIRLAEALFREKQYDEALDALRGVKLDKLDLRQAANYVGQLLNLQSRTEMDLSGAITDFWETILKDNSKRWKPWQKKAAVAATVARAFAPGYLEAEKKEERSRCAYTLFRPLYGVCELGTAAKILDTEDPAEMDAALATVENWPLLPIDAFARALEHGAEFPPANKPLFMEELDALARWLAGVGGCLEKLVAGLYVPEDADDLNWVRALVLAAVQKRNWTSADAGESIALIRLLADVERSFLIRCYAEINENILRLLPPAHRFGCYLNRALDALDSGDEVGFVRLLREGLTACESMKGLAEFLLEQYREGALRPAAGSELRELAEKVKTMMAAFPPDSPELASLKSSPAYQKVAWLLEKQ